MKDCKERAKEAIAKACADGFSEIEGSDGLVFIPKDRPSYSTLKLVYPNYAEGFDVVPTSKIFLTMDGETNERKLACFAELVAIQLDLEEERKEKKERAISAWKKKQIEEEVGC